jgi:nicotinate phosphoribosyltransferase
MMNFDSPILYSLLDDDLYKINMGSVVFHLFPNAWVTYKFINRGKTKFPKGFATELNHQIQMASALQMSKLEEFWLQSIPYMRRTYVEWLAGYQLDPNEVVVMQNGDDVSITVTGWWYRTIHWEVKLMAMISELYYRMTGQYMAGDWALRIEKKAKKLSGAGCHWIDFGTRRRYSYEVQKAVVDIMKGYPGFLGTSNPHLAMKFGVTPHGTYAHESVMAMQALYGARSANKMWMRHWSEHFDGNVGVALTDTFTTEKFLEDFGSYEARLFDGVRQDSGDPNAWALKMISHYKKLGIPTSNKRFVFSDGLDDDKYIAIEKTFRLSAQCVGGIGTFLTNDVGVPALNMVIKMTSADFGKGAVDVVKLSDNIGKHTGSVDAIRQVKAELGIQ